ncbi:MAG: membrane protein insertase YidC [Planctomycetes bacterium]|nr:membrane protein insertase YidC [Planctomycetota bacterium]
MDQRRFFLFLSLCFLLVIVFGPKPKPPQKKPAEGEAAQQAQAEGQPNAADAAPAKSEAPKVEALAEDGVEAEPLEEIASDLEYVTLGSVDPEAPYRLAVTLTNQGAGIRRVELSSPRFRDLHDRGGYLGHLELTTDNSGGLRIQSLVAGTPAAEAGLEVGDRIVSYTNGGTDGGEQTPLTSAEEFGKLLVSRKPRQELTLQVARGEGAPVDRVVTLARRPLEVIRPEVENVLMRTGKLPKKVASPPSFQFTFEQLGREKLPSQEKVKRILAEAEENDEKPVILEEIVGVALRNSNWEIANRDETSVTFRAVLPKYNLEVQKTYRLQPVPAEEQKNKNYPGYGLTLDLVVRNLGEQDMPLRYRLDGPNGLPIEGWWYANKIGREWGAAGIRDVVARHVGNDTVQVGPTTIAKGDAETMQGPPLAFAGVDAQYFSAILLPRKPKLETSWIDEMRSVSFSPEPKVRPIEGKYANVTCRLISHETDLAAGETLEHSYDIFAGPKRPKLLANYHASESTQYGLGDLMYYGWFSPVSKAMLGILHFFYGIIGNYGIAIIMLTVLVRSLMFPISRKQAKSMAKMQELRPEMDKIKAKYKQDMQKQSQATQELYRKHNINPLAGCLPMFIQLPIFLGLYRALMVDVELRQAPLLGDAIRWCSNLASPDMFYDWSSFMPDFINRGEGIFELGPYLNILPLVTCGLFILQQKMFMPEAANEQAAMQQKIMKYMMLFMGFMFFKVAAGLCLYFIASSIWGIAERKMLPKPSTTGALAAASGPSPSSISPYSNGVDTATRRRNKKKKKKR